MSYWIKSYDISHDKMPSPTVIKGVVSLFIATIIFLCVLFLIPYQRKLSGPIKIYTKGKPVTIAATSQGELTTYVADNVTVKKGQIIASLNLTIEPKIIDALERLLLRNVEYQRHLDIMNLREEILPLITHENNRIDIRLRQLDESITTYKNTVTLYNPQNQLKAITQIQDKLVQRLDYHNSLETIQHNTLQLITHQLTKDSILYKSGGLSQREYEDRKLSNQVLYEQIVNNHIKKNEIETYVSQHELEKTELDKAYKQQEQRLRREVVKAKDLLRQDFAKISEQQIIRAPSSGQLIYLPKSISGSDVINGQELMNIIEDDAHHSSGPLAIIQLKSNNIGSIKKGMKIHMNLDAFPSREYGKVTGTLIRISETPIEEYFEGYVDINYPITTSYNKQLEHMPIYHGTAQVVIDKINLLDRIIDEISYLKDHLQ